MSIKCMTRVWDISNPKLKGGKLLLLLAIADHAGDDGYAWPGTSTLARKIRMSERQTLRMIKGIEEIGELFVDRRMYRNRYIVTVGMTPPEVRATLEQRLEYSAQEAQSLWPDDKHSDKMSPCPKDGDKMSSRHSDKMSPCLKDGDIAVSLEPSTTITMTTTAAAQSGDFADLHEGARKIAGTWQLLTDRTLTQTELASLLELVGPRPKIPTSVLLSQLALLAGHDHNLTVNTLIGVVTKVIPVEQVLPGLGNQPDSAAPLLGSLPYLVTPEATMHDTPVQPTLLDSDVDPVLGQIATWYTSEIGPITAMVADDLRDLVQQYPNAERWEMAFRKSAAIGTGLKRWRYIMAVVGGDDEKYRQQKQRRRKQAAGTGQRRGSARPRGSSTRRSQRGHRQLTQAEIDALNTAAAERLAATAEATG